MAVNEAHLALELGITAFRDGFHRIENLPIASFGTSLGLAEGCGDKPGVGRLELLTQGLDELDQVLFIPLEVRGVAHVLVTLSPEESGDFVFFGAGVVFVEIGKYFFGGGHIPIILTAGIGGGHTDIRG